MSSHSIMIHLSTIRKSFKESIHCFLFNDPETTEIYTLSLHDALPIFRASRTTCSGSGTGRRSWARRAGWSTRDRKSTRLNSSHGSISYAVFCLKKKKTNDTVFCLDKKTQNYN